MSKISRFLARRLALGAPFGAMVFLGCQSGPSTSSSSHWLTCERDEDCAGWTAGAVCGQGNYCETSGGVRLVETVVLDADFGDTVDTDLFSFEEGFSIRNGDQEFYTGRSENLFTEDGELVLRALREDYMGASYTSASVSTGGSFSFTYGKIEARIWAPDGTGTSAAFWLLPESPGEAELYCETPDDCFDATWPVWGDMVVMTTRSEAPNSIIQTANFGLYDEDLGAVVRQEGGGTHDLGESVASGYRTYALHWYPGKLEWFIDGELTASADTTRAYQPSGIDPYSRPFHLRLSLAVGGLTEDPDPLAYPQDMRIESLRVTRFE
jgi:beta-glucanase (GH16 family)